MYILASFYISLTQANNGHMGRVNVSEKVAPAHWPIGKSVNILVSDVEESSQLQALSFPGQVVLYVLRKLSDLVMRKYLESNVPSWFPHQFLPQCSCLVHSVTVCDLSVVRRNKWFSSQVACVWCFITAREPLIKTLRWVSAE